MADQDQNDQNTGLNVSDADADALLNDDGSSTEDTGTESSESVTDSTDYKAEVDKWKKLSRQNEKNFREAQRKLQSKEDEGKTESQRLLDERDGFKTQAEKNAAELKRLQIAGETAPEHATLAQLRKVARRMAGEDDSALEEDAKELWADFAPATKSPVAGKPRERLKGGADPDEEPDEMDPKKLAQMISRAR